MRFFDTYIEPSKIRYKITVDLIIKDFVLKTKGKKKEESKGDSKESELL
jgi:hypothetical protein